MIVPQNFNAQFERYQFVMPPISRMTPRIQATPDAQAKTNYAVVTGLTGNPLANSQVLASRLVLRSRHNPNEVTLAALSSPAGVQKLLVEREYLVKR